MLVRVCFRHPFLHTLAYMHAHTHTHTYTHAFELRLWTLYAVNHHISGIFRNTRVHAHACPHTHRHFKYTHMYVHAGSASRLADATCAGPCPSHVVQHSAHHTLGRGTDGPHF